MNLRHSLSGCMFIFRNLKLTIYKKTGVCTDKMFRTLLTVVGLLIKVPSNNDWLICLSLVEKYRVYIYILFPVSDDNCTSLGVSFCLQYGYGRVMSSPPSVTGLYTVTDMQNFLYAVQIQTPVVESECTDLLTELACGLHTTRCYKGSVSPLVCREDCESKHLQLLFIKSLNAVYLMTVILIYILKSNKYVI